MKSERGWTRCGQCLATKAFCKIKGYPNEVGLYIFAYPPEEEMAVRAFVREIRAEYAGEQDKCRVIIYDLYEILLDICRERRILDRIGQMEKQRGQEFMRQQIQRIAPPQAYVDKMKYEPHRAGDVVMIGGVGRVYPLHAQPSTCSTTCSTCSTTCRWCCCTRASISGQSADAVRSALSDDNYYLRLQPDRDLRMTRR